MARKLGRATSTSVPKNDLFPIFKTHQSILALYILYRGNSWKLLIFGTFLMVCVLHFARDGISFKNGPIFVLRKSPKIGRSPRIDRICQGFGNPSENQVELWNVSYFSWPQGLHRPPFVLETSRGICGMSLNFSKNCRCWNSFAEDHLIFHLALHFQLRVLQGCAGAMASWDFLSGNHDF